MSAGLNIYYIWQGLLLEDGDVPDFIEYFLSEHQVHINDVKQIYTKPDFFHGQPIVGTGGRADILIGVSYDDRDNFLTFKQEQNILSIEEIYDTDQEYLYPDLRNYRFFS